MNQFKNSMTTIWKWFWPIASAAIMLYIVVTTTISIQKIVDNMMPLWASVALSTIICAMCLASITLFLGRTLPGFPWLRKRYDKSIRT